MKEGKATAIQCCPRCGTERITVMADAPVGGNNVWRVYLCEQCAFSWRSTERVHILKKFCLTENEIEQMPVNPPVVSPKN